MYTIKDDDTGLPIKCWASVVEPEALQQAKNLSKLPFAFHHIALMPDCHSGYGMPIGGVLATNNVIVPNAVGVDIGCGVLAIKTSITADKLNSNNLAECIESIKKHVPVGFNHNTNPEHAFDSDNLISNDTPVVFNEKDKIDQQLGTLGGGNHFIELQLDEEDNLWYMIHSGSRNLGKKVGDHYNKIAKDLNESYFSSVPTNHDLAFLPAESKMAQKYLSEMNICKEFARQNRRYISCEIAKALIDIIGNDPYGIKVYDISHNYVAIENHFGKNVYVHRKGAIRATKNDICIIPGSQGTNSYICCGAGNIMSFQSCSHGAGRKMGRKVAKQTLDLSQEIRRMNDLGIIHGIKDTDDLDEAPGAYKDIKEVMQNQSDLVTIETTLRPIAVIKG